ncbi:alpha/beta hydrolase [Thalassoroseus pseudoceratinae]|uniref:alpha/beta hydrolase n=1 Tax=Thalassoroseus pseudoceratinae TaxID=2713176 RepID=UPI001F0DA1AB|nr:alpha/beta hydrolase [Thalassoroseus pseudoceratinae]
MKRRRSLKLLMPLLTSCFFVNFAMAAKPVGKRHIYRVVDDRELSLYVTKPDGWKRSDQRPAVVFFHGGGWVGGAPGQFTEHSKYFASRGMVAIQVQYRLLDRKSNDPPTICIEDARAAMIWVRNRADELGIDPQRIASAGGSAGGHLAAFVGMVDHAQDTSAKTVVSSKSNAMLLFNPVFDNGPDGWGQKRVGQRYQEFSPMHNITADDPPAIVFLGSADKLIPVKTVEKFQDEMEKAGNRCEIHIYKNQPHGFFNHGRDGNRWYYETVMASDRFLESLGWLSGEPTLEKPKSK